ncbi:hypothetical protein NW765_013427 [Fusarium oxysporum]|nr:hypothetical protein NW765_013427 [Fusarium oxysporum]
MIIPQSAEHRDCVVSDRGGIVENTHLIHVAVTDASGQILFAVGNPARITLARSTAKPIQILALLETKGFESSEESHITRGTEMLVKVAASEKDLRCGGHPALSEAVNRDWIRRDFVPGALCNNCSAKHIGMLAGAKAIDPENAENYHEGDHMMQLCVKAVFEEDLSYLYAVLADAADSPKGTDSLESGRKEKLARIYRAMWQYPEMVAGQGRFCTELMLQYKGGLVGKLGADGCYGIAVKESEQTRNLGARGGLGIAVKVEDGDSEILYAVVVEVLERLKVGSSKQLENLDVFHHLTRVNTAGVVTGRVSLDFRLNSC